MLRDAAVATWRHTPPVTGLYEHLAWCRGRHQSPATIEKRRGAMRRLARALQADPLYATGEQLQRWQQTRNLAAISLVNEIAQLRMFYKWAVDAGMLEEDPSRRLVPPRKPRRKPRPISEDDLARALHHAPAHIRPWLVLAAYCGLRACEVAGLTRDQVQDQACPPVLVIAGKGGHERVVPMGENVLAELRAYGLPSRGAVFRRRDGLPGPYSPARLSHVANDYLHSLGIEDTFHSLRHRMGTRLYAETMDLRLTGEVMGHHDVATTAGYVAYCQSRAVQALQSMDAELQAC